MSGTAEKKYSFYLLCMFIFLLCLYNLNYLHVPFGFEGRTSVLIVSVPGRCLSVTLHKQNNMLVIVFLFIRNQIIIIIIRHVRFMYI